MAGPYTHYVDNTDPSATDGDNPNGTPAKPRKTIPSTLPAGSVVEVHGGPYGDLYIATNGAKGTAANPIFIRGYSATNRPVMTAGYENKPIKGCSYLIIENIDFAVSPRLNIFQPSDHISIRNCIFRDAPESLGNAAFRLWSDSAGGMNDLEDYIVLYQCQIHNNGYPPTHENGMHGIMISNGARNVWILDNQIYNNGEDNIQIYWQSGRNQPWAKNIYIGGNTMYDQSGKMENAVDIKQSEDVIVSSNDVHGYRQPPWESSDGSAVVLNDDSPSDRLWVINNHIHDSTIGIRTQSVGTNYIVGNLIEDIHGEPGVDEGGTAIRGYQTSSTSYSSTTYAVNNTIYKCDAGPVMQTGKKWFLENNIISTLNDTSRYHLEGRQGSSKFTVKNELFYQPGATSKLRVDGNTYNGASAFDAAGKGSGDREGNPLFVNVGVDFGLQTDSPAIDNGIVSSVYATFESLYGLNIQQDRNGTVRPVGTWDIGAYEASGLPTPPSPPSDLHVIGSP